MKLSDPLFVERNADAFGHDVTGTQLREYADLLRLLQGQATGMTDALVAIEPMGNHCFLTQTGWAGHIEKLYTHARLLESALAVARMDERERCAKVCEDSLRSGWVDSQHVNLAEKIRALPTTQAKGGL